jgi:hypothetical protein
MGPALKKTDETFPPVPGLTFQTTGRAVSGQPCWKRLPALFYPKVSICRSRRSEFFSAIRPRTDGDRSRQREGWTQAKSQAP